ncbi:hypothetical protein JXO59_00770, partial [candidate division KSB1 bacterium]|nr:hypothetical protein [candidate division KSB1 bacterium]
SLIVRSNSGKPYEGKPHVRFDEGSRETGLLITAPLSYSTDALLVEGKKKNPALLQVGIFFIIQWVQFSGRHWIGSGRIVIY